MSELTQLSVIVFPLCREKLQHSSTCHKMQNNEGDNLKLCQCNLPHMLFSFTSVRGTRRLRNSCVRFCFQCATLRVQSSALFVFSRCIFCVQTLHKAAGGFCSRAPRRSLTVPAGHPSKHETGQILKEKLPQKKNMEGKNWQAFETNHSRQIDRFLQLQKCVFHLILVCAIMAMVVQPRLHKWFSFFCALCGCNHQPSRLYLAFFITIHVL